MSYLTVKFKGRHTLYSEHDTRKDTVKLLQDLKWKRRLRGNRAPCAWAEEGRYSCHTATLVCLTVLHCGCLKGLSLQQNEVLSTILSCISILQLLGVSSACHNPVFLLYAAILIHTQCLSQPQKTFILLPQPFRNHDGCWKECSRSVSKVLGTWRALHV
jgi:hypothetical protein